MSQVQWAIDKYWIRQSILRGWYVISPAAPNGRSFYEGSEDLVPEMLDSLLTKYNIEADKFHLAGISAGGLSAFRVAINFRNRFLSLLVFPGGAATDAEYAKLDSLVGIPVTMFVGANDSQEWIKVMDSTAYILDSLGVHVDYHKLSGEGHVIDGLTSAMLFDILDAARP